MNIARIIAQGILFSALWISLAGPVFAAWRWQLPTERYKMLNPFERDLYNKAVKQMQAQKYKEAAATFEKFKIQFPDTSELGYILFMRGFALHHQNQRNTAIKVYQEVLDYFGDNVDLSAMALYHMGQAYLQNGDQRDGLECMDEIVKDPELKQHDLAAGALRQLADNHWKNGQKKEAVRYWQQTYDDFAERNPHESIKALDSALGYYIQAADYSGLSSWIFSGERAQDPKFKYRIWERVMSTGYHGFRYHWRAHYRFKKKALDDAIQAFMNFFMTSHPEYKKVNEWLFYERMVSFSVHNASKTARNQAVDAAMIFIGKKYGKDAKQAGIKYGWILDRLREVRDYKKATICLQKISDPHLRQWKTYELAVYQGKNDAAASTLLELTKSGDATWAGKAQLALADHYRERMRKYDEAVKLYRMINKPPDTLWRIQDALIRKGDLKQAVTTLNEIENFFPKHAPRAAMTKADYYKQAGDRQKAIAQCRRVLKLYPKSSFASKAHVMLEGFGIATGGGLASES